MRRQILHRALPDALPLVLPLLLLRLHGVPPRGERSELVH